MKYRQKIVKDANVSTGEIKHHVLIELIDQYGRILAKMGVEVPEKHIKTGNNGSAAPKIDDALMRQIQKQAKSSIENYIWLCITEHRENIDVIKRQSIIRRCIRKFRARGVN